MAANPYTDEDLRKAQRRLEVVKAGRAYRQAHQRQFAPQWYGWQRAFFEASKDHAHVCCIAANQIGKSLTATYQDALDLTGDYPADWIGLKFEGPINAWALGVDNNQLKDVLQKNLIGLLNDDNTVTGGWIHPDEVIKVVRSQTPGLAREIHVKHKSGGTSILSLRAYSQAKTGSESLPFAGSVVDLIHVDEQPPDEIIGQLVIRTTNGRGGKGGLIRYTMTPELGMTSLVSQFMERRSKHQALIGPIGWDQAPHITPERAEQLLAGVPEFERDMRSKGLPFFGSGLVFPVAEESIKVEPFQIPAYYRVLRALDIGIDHPTAGAWLAYDPEGDVIYLTRTYRRANEIVPVHAVALNAQWAHSPLVVPHDADQREKGSGETVRSMYEQCGVRNTVMFQNPDGSRFVEPGLMAMLERMRTGRFKVFSTCLEWWDEMRKYHRERGKIVALDDDVISATRYGFQMVQTHGVPVDDAPALKHYAPQWKL